MLCLFGLVMVFSLSVFYAANIRLEWLAILTCVIFASSFLLRKQRLLIQALCTKKGTQHPSRSSRPCRNSSRTPMFTCPQSL
jgi:cell division protein FtsW (lipid II flippase)